MSPHNLNISSVSPGTLSVLCTAVSPAHRAFSGNACIVSIYHVEKWSHRVSSWTQSLTPNLSPFSYILLLGQSWYWWEENWLRVELASAVTLGMPPAKSFPLSQPQFIHFQLCFSEPQGLCPWEEQKQILLCPAGGAVGFPNFFPLCWRMNVPPGNLWFWMILVPPHQNAVYYHPPP